VLLNIQTFEKFFKGSLPILDEYCASGGHLQIGGMDYDGLRERMPQLLLYAREGVTRVKQIVGDLKDFAGQRASDVRDAVDLNKVVQKAMALVEHLIKRSTDAFVVNLAPQMPVIIGNSQRLEQVVMNLLVNACQALTNRHDSISVATGVHPEKAQVWLEVRDTGAGMAPEVLERITDPFFTTRRDNGGIGLGLSISDTIVRDHSGWLSFVSREGEGTTATLTFPSGPATSAGKRGDIA
jgi:polar amino acid transport system substrate-binding protein